MNLKATTLAAAAAGAAIAPQAAAKPPTQRHVRAYVRAYHAAARKFGHRAPGRNIVRWGLQGRKATDRDVTRSLQVLQRMLAPPPPAPLVPARVAVAGPQAVSTTPVASGGGGVPACASESGTNYSTGPANTNPSSGATGRYQITPGTSAAHHCDLSTPAGQDACAAVIFRTQGAGAWVGCGG